MSKIIVGGCSFTDKNMPRHAKPNAMDFKMWPEVLGEVTEREVINVGVCGSGNRSILHNVVKEVLKHNPKDIDAVIVAWSEWTRQDILSDNKDYTDYPFRTILPRVSDVKDSFTKDSIVDSETKVDSYYDMLETKFPKDIDIMNDNLQIMYMFQCFCNENHLNFLQMQMLPTYNKFRKESNTTANYDTEETLDPDKYPTDLEMEKRQIRERDFIKNPISLLIEDSKFIGYPIFERLGGYNMLELLRKTYGESYRISGIDAHPNEESHRFLADRVLEALDL